LAIAAPTIFHFLNFSFLWLFSPGRRLKNVFTPPRYKTVQNIAFTHYAFFWGLLTSVTDPTARSVGAASVSQVRTSAKLFSRSRKLKGKYRSGGLK